MKITFSSLGSPLHLFHYLIIEDPSLDADPLQCQPDMEAVVGHQAAEVDLLHQVVVVAILPLLQALVNASALQEKAAWLGEQEKKPPIIVSINSHTTFKVYRDMNSVT